MLAFVQFYYTSEMWFCLAYYLFEILSTNSRQSLTGISLFPQARKFKLRNGTERLYYFERKKWVIHSLLSQTSTITQVTSHSSGMSFTCATYTQFDPQFINSLSVLSLKFNIFYIFDSVTHINQGWSIAHT